MLIYNSSQSRLLHVHGQIFSNIWTTKVMVITTSFLSINLVTFSLFLTESDRSVSFISYKQFKFKWSSLSRLWQAISVKNVRCQQWYKTPRLLNVKPMLISLNEFNTTLHLNIFFVWLTELHIIYVTTEIVLMSQKIM